MGKKIIRSITIIYSIFIIVIMGPTVFSVLPSAIRNFSNPELRSMMPMVIAFDVLWSIHMSVAVVVSILGLLGKFEKAFCIILGILVIESLILVGVSVYYYETWSSIWDMKIALIWGVLCLLNKKAESW